MIIICWSDQTAALEEHTWTCSDATMRQMLQIWHSNDYPQGYALHVEHAEYEAARRMAERLGGSVTSPVPVATDRANMP